MPRILYRTVCEEVPESGSRRYKAGMKTVKQGRRQGVQGPAGKSSGTNIEKTERNERDGATERRNASQLL